MAAQPMAEGARTGAESELAYDSHFLKLAAYKTEQAEFEKLVGTHVYGYSQKKLLLDALKDLLKKVDDAELKQSYAKNLGKKKGLDEDELILVNLYSTHDLKEKTTLLTAQVQAMIEEGKITHEEKPHVLENLKKRFETAKANNKEKLQEKLQGHIAAVSKAGSFFLDVTNLKEISLLHRRLEEIASLEKRPPKSLTYSEKELIGEKASIQSEFREMEENSRMWFESAATFKPRLQRALERLAQQEAEQRKKEEEEAFERKRREEEEAIEKKKQEAAAKQEAKHQEMLAKLEAKRLEDQLKPQKAAPQPAKPKEKKKAKRLDPNTLFVHNRSTLADFEEAQQEEGADAEEEPEEDEEEEETPAPAPVQKKEAPKPAAPAPAAPAAAPAAPSKPAAPSVSMKASASGYPEGEAAPAAPKAKAEPKKKVVLENKWGTDDLPAAVAAAAAEEGEEPSDSALPSLADAAASVASAPAAKTKTPPPQPKKKEKKKFTKVSATDLGFDANNPNYVN